MAARYAYLTRSNEYTEDARVRLADDASLDPEDHNADALAAQVPEETWYRPGENVTHAIDRIEEEDD